MARGVGNCRKELVYRLLRSFRATYLSYYFEVVHTVETGKIFAIKDV
jgi:hypothetical protein